VWHRRRAVVSARSFLIPESAGNGQCGFGGLAYVGCSVSNCRSWLRGMYASYHEFGHPLLGMNHASTDPNNDGGTAASRIVTH
jgi:hypothetical protein